MRRFTRFGANKLHGRRNTEQPQVLSAMGAFDDWRQVIAQFECAGF
jgi:hypothetical protein